MAESLQRIRKQKCMKTLTQTSRYMALNENMRLVLSKSVMVAIMFMFIFAIAKIFHLESVTELRFINYVLLFPVAYSVIKKYYDQHGHKIEYFTGFTMVFLIGALGQFWYSLLFFFYLHIDSQFMDYLMAQFPRKILYPELSIAFVLLSEGISISVIVALATMQYFKRKRGRWAATK
jgi:hypothetical protein